MLSARSTTRTTAQPPAAAPPAHLLQQLGVAVGTQLGPLARGLLAKRGGKRLRLHQVGPQRLACEAEKRRRAVGTWAICSACTRPASKPARPRLGAKPSTTPPPLLQPPAAHPRASSRGPPAGSAAASSRGSKPCRGRSPGCIMAGGRQCQRRQAHVNRKEMHGGRQPPATDNATAASAAPVHLLLPSHVLLPHASSAPPPLHTHPCAHLGPHLFAERLQLLLPNHPRVAKPAAVGLDARGGQLLGLEVLRAG